jgi:hypothetical protein
MSSHYYRAQRGLIKQVMTKNIYVTQPDLPPLDEFTPYLKQIWESKILTNGGPFHQQLEPSLWQRLPLLPKSNQRVVYEGEN